MNFPLLLRFGDLKIKMSGKINIYIVPLTLRYLGRAKRQRSNFKALANSETLMSF